MIFATVFFNRCTWRWYLEATRVGEASHPGPADDDDVPIPLPEAVAILQPFKILSWNLHGLENNIDKVLAMSFDVLLLQEADVEDASVHLMRQKMQTSQCPYLFL